MIGKNNGSDVGRRSARTAPAVAELATLAKQLKTRMIEFAGHSFELHPYRALVWPARRTLVVADLHFGKASHFRAAGVPVPVGTTSHDLLRLSMLIGMTGATRLLILGDLLHGKDSRADSTCRAVAEWRKGHEKLAITLVRGNHDRAAGDPPRDWRFDVVPAGPFVEDGIAFQHEPPTVMTWRTPPTVCGHVHPAARIEDFDGSAAGVACFVVEDRMMILPAFGRFTGTAKVERTETRRLYAVAADRVVKV
jgi:uncharacterized protein